MVGNGQAFLHAKKHGKQPVQGTATTTPVQAYLTPDVLPQAWGGTLDRAKVQEAILVKLRLRYKNAAAFSL